MNKILTDAQRRDAAWFTADVFRAEFKRLRRRLKPDETVMAAHGAARLILDAATGNPMPSRPRSWLPLALSGGTDFTSRAVTQAENVIRYFEIAGDNARATDESKSQDRKIAELFAEQRARAERSEDDWFRPSDKAVAVKVGLSHTSVRDRRLARCSRIIAALHRDCPDLWDVNGLPVREARGTGRIWDTAASSGRLFDIAA